MPRIASITERPAHELGDHIHCIEFSQFWPARKCCSAIFLDFPERRDGPANPFADRQDALKPCPGFTLEHEGHGQATSPRWWSQPGAGYAPAAIMPKQYRELAGAPGDPPEPGRCSPTHREIGLVQPVIHPDDDRALSTAAAGLDLLPPVSAARRARPRCAPGWKRWQRTGPSRAGPRRRPAVPSPALIDARHRGGADERRRHPGDAGHRHRQDASTQRGIVTGTLDRASAAHGADAAGLRLRRPASMRTPRRRRPAARISPTMPRSPNGPGITVATSSKARAANVKLTTDGGFRTRRGAAHGGARRHAHRHRLRRASLSPTAITSCSAACASRMTRSVTGHSDADVVLHALVDAILGALADGDIGVHFPPERSAMARRLVGPVPRISPCERVRARGGTHRASRCHRSSARRRGSARIATPCARASPRSPASRSIARRRQGDHEREDGLHRPRAKASWPIATATIRLPWSD